MTTDLYTHERHFDEWSVSIHDDSSTTVEVLLLRWLSPDSNERELVYLIVPIGRIGGVMSTCVAQLRVGRYASDVANMLIEHYGVVKK